MQRAKVAPTLEYLYVGSETSNPLLSQIIESMFALLERWAALEPQWCRLTDDGINFGPEKDDDWIGWDWDNVPWREAGSVLQAVMQAIEQRGWRWERHQDGTITVGQPATLYSIVLAGTHFAQDLLNAYVQRLEMEVKLLVINQDNLIP